MFLVLVKLTLGVTALTLSGDLFSSVNPFTSPSVTEYTAALLSALYFGKSIVPFHSVLPAKSAAFKVNIYFLLAAILVNVNVTSLVLIPPLQVFVKVAVKVSLAVLAYLFVITQALPLLLTVGINSLPLANFTFPSAVVPVS